MHKHDFQEDIGSDYNFSEDYEEIDVDMSDIEEQEMKRHAKIGRPHARRSVEEYLERKRLRERYKELFDDYFGEKS